MAQRNIKFNNNEYPIKESKFDPAVEKLVNYFSTQLAGTGVTLTIDGVQYNLDGTKVGEASNVLTNFATDNAGTGYKMNIGGTGYEVSETKLANAVETMNVHLGGLAEPVLVPSEGLEFGLLSDGASYALIGMGTCTDIDLVIPSHYNGLPVTRILTYSTFQTGEDSPPDDIPEVDYDREKYKGISLYNSNVRSIVIPGTVNTIEAYAFVECFHLESVILCEGVTSIEKEAFSCCNNLANISIPSSVTYIEYRAFGNYFVGNKHSIHIHINAPENSIAGAPWSARYGVIYWNSTGPTAETMQSPRLVLNDDGASYCVVGAGDYTGTELVIPSMYNGLPVTAIAGHAFAHNTRITSIIFNGTTDEWYGIVKDEYWNLDVPVTYVQCTDGQVSF